MHLIYIYIYIYIYIWKLRQDKCLVNPLSRNIFQENHLSAGLEY